MRNYCIHVDFLLLLQVIHPDYNFVGEQFVDELEFEDVVEREEFQEIFDRMKFSGQSGARNSFRAYLMLTMAAYSTVLGALTEVRYLISSYSRKFIL